MGYFGWSMLAGLLSLATGCSRVSQDTPAPIAPADGEAIPASLAEDAPLDQVLAAARDAADRRTAFLEAHTLQVHTLRHLPDDAPASFDSEVSQRAGRRRIHTRSTRLSEGMELDWEYVELFDGRAVRRWYLAGHNQQVTERKGTPQHIRLERWFDHAAVTAGGLELLGDQVMDGRDTVYLRFHLDDTLEGPAYAPPAPVPRARLDELLAPSGLRLVEGTVDYDGDGSTERIGAIRLSHWLDQAGPDATVERACLAPFRPRMRPVHDHVPTIPEAPPRSSRAFASADAFDVCSGIWLDREALHPARLDWIQLQEDSRRDVSLRWSDFREVAAGVDLPHQLEYWVDDSLYSTSTVTAIVATPTDGGSFRSRDIQRALDLQAQLNNRAELDHLIAQTDVKQAEPSADRDPVFHPVELVAELGLQPGDVAADVGAGTGYFLPYIAEAVGSEGRVIAVEVNPALIRYLDDRMRDPALDPHGVVETHRCDYDELGLPPASVDLAFLAGVGLGRFVTLDDPNQRMLASVFQAIRPGGRLALVENRSQGSRVPAVSLPWLVLDDELQLAGCGSLGCENIPAMFGPMDAVLMAAWQSVGFEFERSVDLIEGQAFLIFRRPPDSP